MDTIYYACIGGVLALAAIIMFGRRMRARGERMGRAATVAGYEAALVELGVDPDDGGSLGDLSFVHEHEEQEDRWHAEQRRRAWRRKWLPWVRLHAWRTHRRFGGDAEFWKEKHRQAVQERGRTNDMYWDMVRERNRLKRENAFLKGDLTADPTNGQPWPPLRTRDNIDITVARPRGG